MCYALTCTRLAVFHCVILLDLLRRGEGGALAASHTVAGDERPGHCAAMFLIIAESLLRTELSEVVFGLAENTA